MNILSLWPWLIPAAFAVGAILAAKKSRESNPENPPRNRGPEAWEKYHRQKQDQNNFFIVGILFAVLAVITALVVWQWPDWWILLSNGKYLPFD